MRFIDRETIGALAEPAFQSFSVSRAASGAATSLFQAAVLWQVYALTGSAWQLALVGLVRFLPVIPFTLVGGAAADTYDRRRILQYAQAIPLLPALAMLVAISTGTVSLLLLYGLVFMTGVASAFDLPARLAMIQLLVPRTLFRGAIVVAQTIQAMAAVGGPALAGVLIALGGSTAAYSAYALLLVISIGALATIRLDTAGMATGRGVTFAAMLEGMRFIGKRPVLLGVMSLDLVVVVFGGAKALLPIYATDILNVGPAGYGLLAASAEIGSLICALVMVLLPKPTRTGRALLLTLVAYGVAVVAFGLSTSLLWAVLFYALTGAADQVSVVLRSTTIQLSTPDDLRGRVTSVSSVFTNSSVQLGAVESGLVAAATNAVFAVVSGGAIVLVVVALVAWLVPELRTYRTPASTDGGEGGEAPRSSPPATGAGISTGLG